MLCTGVLAAAIFAGMLVGGLSFGLLSDRIGRRKSLLYSLLINAVFALLSSVSFNVYTLILCRALAGVGIGGTVPAMFTLCSEHVPTHRRGFYVTIVASYWMVVRALLQENDVLDVFYHGFLSVGMRVYSSISVAHAWKSFDTSLMAYFCCHCVDSSVCVLVSDVPLCP
jgi:MFS family permease